MELQDKINEIRQETQRHANTKERLADVLDLIDRVKLNTDLSNLSDEVRQQLQGDIVALVKQNPIAVKNILDNVQGHTVLFENYSYPDSKVVFWIDGERVDYGLQQVRWTITDQQEITFKWEDYYNPNDPIHMIVVKDGNGYEAIITESDPEFIAPAIDGSASYNYFAIGEIADPNMIYHDVSVRWNKTTGVQNASLMGKSITSGQSVIMVRDKTQAFEVRAYGDFRNKEYEIIVADTGTVLGTFTKITPSNMATSIKTEETELIIRERIEDKDEE